MDVSTKFMWLSMVVIACSILIVFLCKEEDVSYNFKVCVMVPLIVAVVTFVVALMCKIIAA